MVGEQLKYGVCNWILHMKCRIVLIINLLIILGRLSINEICSSALKFMKIDTTAVCVKTLEQHHVCKVLVPHNQCEADSYKNLSYPEQDKVTCQDGPKRKDFFQGNVTTNNLKRIPAFQTNTARSMFFNCGIKIVEDRQRNPQIVCVLHILKTRSNTERDSLFSTNSFGERFNLLQSNTLLNNDMIVSNQHAKNLSDKLKTEVFDNWECKCSITDKSSSLVSYQDILQTTVENWVMNSLKADKRITMKIKKEADRKGMSEKHVAILAYCDYVNRCISHHELMIPKEEALSLQRLTQDISRIVFQRFESYFNDNPTDDSLGTSIEKCQDTSGPVSMRTNGELRKEEYNLFTNSTKCQLCVDRNKAVNWCNTCGKNICDFCKVFHQKVWDVMDHDILPLRITF